MYNLVQMHFFYLVYLPSLLSDDLQTNAHNELSFPHAFDKESCFLFEYLLEGSSPFDMKVLSTLSKSDLRTVLELKADGKCLFLLPKLLSTLL